MRSEIVHLRYVALAFLIACGAPSPAPTSAPPSAVAPAPTSSTPVPVSASASSPVASAPAPTTPPAPEPPPSIAPFVRSATKDGRYVLVGYVTELNEFRCKPCLPPGPDCAACAASFAHLADHDVVDDPAKLCVTVAPGQIPPDLVHQRVRAVVRVTHGTRPTDRYVALVHVSLASAPLEPIPVDAVKAQIKADVVPAPHSRPAPRPSEPPPDPGPSPTPPDRAGLRLRLVIGECWRETRKPIVGTATLATEILPDGSVKSASVRGTAPEEIRTCIVERVKPMQFGSALDGLRLQIDLTFAAP